MVHDKMEADLRLQIKKLTEEKEKAEKKAEEEKKKADKEVKELKRKLKETMTVLMVKAYNYIEFESYFVVHL